MRFCLVLLVTSVLVLSVSLTIAREVPVSRQCKEHCRDVRSYVGMAIKLCEKTCESSKVMGRGRERLMEEVSNPNRNLLREFVGGDEEEESGGYPYVFHDQHFKTVFETQQGRVRVLPKFTERSELFKGIENFRVLLFEASPQTFIVPNHLDADAIFFVVQGRGTVTLVFNYKRQSFNIEQGHVMVIPAGLSVYMINTGNHERLILAQLVNPISYPDQFEPFFGAGDQDSGSYFSAFSTEVLEAAFKTSGDRLQRIFTQQRAGAIIGASEEQIRALTHENNTVWPIGSNNSVEYSPIDLLRQRPKESNDFGKLFEIDPSYQKVLMNLGVAVSFANISQGYMHTPFYNTRATKIAVVVNGRGKFEMSSPHIAGSDQQQFHQQGHDGRRSRQFVEEIRTWVHYGKISSELRPGTVFVVPAGHPFVTMASEDENLEVISFEVNALHNRKFPLAGRKNIMQYLEREAKELAFATSAEEVDKVLESQDEEFFFRGPSLRQRRLGISIY